jgi:hypothetical protein
VRSYTHCLSFIKDDTLRFIGIDMGQKHIMSSCKVAEVLWKYLHIRTLMIITS